MIMACLQSCAHITANKKAQEYIVQTTTDDGFLRSVLNFNGFAKALFQSERQARAIC